MMEYMVMELKELLTEMDTVYKAIKRMIYALEADSISDTKEVFDELKFITNNTNYNFVRQINSYIEAAFKSYWERGDE